MKSKQFMTRTCFDFQSHLENFKKFGSQEEPNSDGKGDNNIFDGTLNEFFEKYFILRLRRRNHEIFFLKSSIPYVQVLY